MFIRPELLAPAGSFDALRAAVWAGADAVYLGGKSFSARAGAVNFDEQTLQEAVRFAHRAKVKIYVTVNTLLKEDELPAAIRFLQYILSIGADAAIVQDLGLVQLARQHVPRLLLHASTQMTTTSLSGVRALKEIGLSRVVLSRELSLAQIREIASAGVLPVEVFLHGALCVAYSGQCLFSSLLGGRSGNRGQCAQPCRLPFSSRVAMRPYLLSPKDLCLIDRLPELLGAGASSLKIEGRLKRPEYVAEVVSIYRRAIDTLLETGRYSVTTEERSRLAQAFNRGFTTGYLLGKPRGNLYSGHRPDNRGVVVGQVVSSRGTSVCVLLTEEVSPGDVLDVDGLSITITQAGKAGETLTMDLRELPAASKGGLVAKVVDTARNAALMQAVNAYEAPSIPIDWLVAGGLGLPLRVRAKAHGKVVEVQGERPLECAKTAVDLRDVLNRQLQKLGGTPFVMGTVAVQVSPKAHIPLSEINNCRRKAVRLLEKEIWGKDAYITAPKLALTALTKTPTTARLVVSINSVSEAEAAVRGGADCLVVGEEWLNLPPAKLLDMYHAVRARHPEVPTAMRLPRILHSYEELQWQELLPRGVELYASSPGAVRLANERGSVVRGDSGLNIMNSASCHALPMVHSVTLSLELSSKEIAALAKHTYRS